MRILIFFIFISTYGSGFAQSANGKKGPVFKEGFENAADFLKGWYFVEYGLKDNISQVTKPVRAGQHAAKIQLKQDDPESNVGNKRSELVYNVSNNESGIDSTLRWYAFSNYFPKTYTTDDAEEIVAQWHDKSPECSASPTLAIEIKANRFRARIRYSTGNYCSNRESIVERSFDLGPVTKSKWNDWLVYYLPRTDSTGIVRIWKNRKLLLEYSGPAQYIGSWFPYFKVGLYKWSWMPDWKGTPSTTTSRSYYLDEVRIGRDSTGMRIRPKAK
ncbi:polysaccharide lyase [Flavihumibacter petaseus]|uniref:Uncharacterized protein n=1 Tax=Flavihumibacter petaseus NBRC 106054 TaxID=1220578 RepID=A0A0E9MXZ0_9BACT|nr:polysaccharide lyase [Flavihumibacter petaseus]GAO42363.1 hypothetical protein FPE01S_01_13770 [Flavihumibacter petaseus NBRC 106054]